MQCNALQQYRQVELELKLKLKVVKKKRKEAKNAQYHTLHSRIQYKARTRKHDNRIIELITSVLTY